MFIGGEDDRHGVVSTVEVREEDLSDTTDRDVFELDFLIGISFGSGRAGCTMPAMASLFRKEMSTELMFGLGDSSLSSGYLSTRKKVFEKFHRARKADFVRAGTGLGLAISRGFVEAMGGSIDANNRTDRSGAVLTMRFDLPSNALMGSSE